GSGNWDMQAADINGDGKSDLIFKYPSTNQLQTFLSNGDGTFQQALFTNAFSPQGSGNWDMQAADINGDGKSDLIFKYPSTNQLQTFLVSLPFPDLLTRMANGLNVSIIITYTPLTAPTVYTKDATAVYPVVDIQAPMYVVSSVATSDGIGGNHATDYTYAGAKSHQLGGGFLGFRQTTVRDRQTGIRSTTNYRQTYPYHGAPLSTERRTGNNTLIGQSLITYTDQLLNTGISPTWHQSLPTRTTESSYELNGSLISTAITDTVYDNYGNPTSIVVNSGGGYSKTTTNTYDNLIDGNRWFLGRLRRSTVNSVTP
ncbi:MAG: toxin TcdB middle/N-terminal domain-containing protein, partial [Thiobacillus sp.]